MSHDPQASELSPDDGLAPPRSTIASGKYAIVVIGVLAISLASLAFLYQYHLQHRPLEYWGAGTATLLLSAPEVEALLLAPIEPSLAEPGVELSETFAADDRTWLVAARHDISRAPGFSHVRRSLMMGGSYDWEVPPPTEPIEWRYALIFRGQAPFGEEAVVLFTAEGGRLTACSPLTLEQAGRSVSVQPVAEALRGFLVEQFPEQTPSPE
jgi:hypothetical protein